MSSRSLTTILLASALLGGLGSGCGSSPSPVSGPGGEKTLAMQEVGEMYRLYSATAKKAPKKVEDFQSAQQVTPNGYRAVKDGSIVVVWGSTLTDTSEEGASKDSSDEILAYEKAVPEQGGLVLMKNRTVKTMTADEFKSLSKDRKS